VKADRTRNRVRFPVAPNLRSVFDYLRRAYTAEPQPKRIDEGVTYLAGLGFGFVWTGRRWGLECRGCMRVYVRSGHAGNHKCSSSPLAATSSERAKNPPQALEGSSAPDRMSWDLPEAETSFERIKRATHSPATPEPDETAVDASLPVAVGAPERGGHST
jgi:hypothetical protein